MTPREKQRSFLQQVQGQMFTPCKLLELRCIHRSEQILCSSHRERIVTERVVFRHCLPQQPSKIPRGALIQWSQAHCAN